MRGSFSDSIKNDQKIRTGRDRCFKISAKRHDLLPGLDLPNTDRRNHGNFLFPTNSILMEGKWDKEANSVFLKAVIQLKLSENVHLRQIVLNFSKTSRSTKHRSKKSQ